MLSPLFFHVFRMFRVFRGYCELLAASNPAFVKPSRAHRLKARYTDHHFPSFASRAEEKPNAPVSCRIAAHRVVAAHVADRLRSERAAVAAQTAGGIAGDRIIPSRKALNHGSFRVSPRPVICRRCSGRRDCGDGRNPLLYLFPRHHLSLIHI